ncbi:TPA: LPXTG cell wall anchor domain-containing protein [Streptococcus suis]
MKRSSRKKQLAKWSKLGLSLAAVTVLGGLVDLMDVPPLSNSTVEAQELTNQSGGEQDLPADTATVTIELENTGVVELVGASYRYQRIRGFERLEIHLQPGETYTLPTYDGHKLINFKNFNEVTDITLEEATISYADFTPGQRVRLYYDYLMTNQVYDVVTKQYVDRETAIPSTTPSINSPTSTPTAQPAETSVEQSGPTEKPVETPSETSATSPAETPTNVQPSTDPAGQSATEPTVLSKQASQAGTASPTGQSAPGKQETKQEAKEQAAPASPSKQATAKSAPTSQPQAKSLPATGEAHSVLHMTGMSLLGLAGLVVKRRSRKSS